MQIINLSPEAILYLAEAATRADAQGRRFRVAVDYYEDGRKALMYKVGEGMWSPPFYDQPDPYRDAPAGCADHRGVNCPHCAMVR